MIICRHFYIIFLLTSSQLCSASLQEDGAHVCKKTRLVNVLDEFTSWRDDWLCENNFPLSSCNNIRGGVISIYEVFIPMEQLVCCPGWSTDNVDSSACLSPCSEGFYGHNCSIQCRCLHGNDCNAVDGSCDCLAGWKGHDCDKRCDQGEYGQNCASTTDICNNGVNDRTTGDCLCNYKYNYHSNCQNLCTPDDYEYCGVVDCERCENNYPGCDESLGVCQCRPGWRGHFCTEPCDVGTGGDYCLETCCSENGHCNSDGTCFCTDGYVGETCEMRCDDGFFGRDCKYECDCPSCHHVTGLCVTCPIGYMGERCDNVCPGNLWNHECNSTCSCLPNEICDIFTGECGTKDGFITTTTTAVIPTKSQSTTTATNDNTDQNVSKGTTYYIIMAIGAIIIVVLFLVLVFWLNRHVKTFQTKRRRTFKGLKRPVKAVDNGKSLSSDEPNIADKDSCYRRYDDISIGRSSGEINPYATSGGSIPTKLEKDTGYETICTISQPTETVHDS